MLIGTTNYIDFYCLSFSLLSAVVGPLLICSFWIMALALILIIVDVSESLNSVFPSSPFSILSALLSVLAWSLEMVK